MGCWPKEEKTAYFWHNFIQFFSGPDLSCMLIIHLCVVNNMFCKNMHRTYILSCETVSMNEDNYIGDVEKLYKCHNCVVSPVTDNLTSCGLECAC